MEEGGRNLVGGKNRNNPGRRPIHNAPKGTWNKRKSTNELSESFVHTRNVERSFPKKICEHRGNVYISPRSEGKGREGRQALVGRT